MNTAMLLEMAAEGMPDRIAVGSHEDGLTYADLLDRARRAAALIAGSGAERVGFVGANSEILPVLVFATAFAGVPFVPVNYRLADDRLRGLVSRIAPALVVVDREGERIRGHRRCRGARPAALRGPPCADRCRAKRVPSSPTNRPCGCSRAGPPGNPRRPSCAIVTSRPTSSPPSSSCRPGRTEATLVSVPPYHIAGLAAVLSNTYVGRRIVYLPQFDPKEWVEVARREDVTHAMVVPTMLGRILDALDESGTELPSLTHLSYGGGRMPMAVVERALHHLPGVGFVNAYGLTETSSTVAVLDPEDHRIAFASEDPDVRERLGSVGRPLPTVELEIRDPDGTVLPAGESGEIYVRGDQIAGEYEGRISLSEDGMVRDERRRPPGLGRVLVRRGTTRRRHRAGRRERLFR